MIILLLYTIGLRAQGHRTYFTPPSVAWLPSQRVRTKTIAHERRCHVYVAVRVAVCAEPKRFLSSENDKERWEQQWRVCTALLCVLQCAQNEAHTQKSKNDIARERLCQTCVAVCDAMCVAACVAACAERKTLPYESERKKSDGKDNRDAKCMLQCVQLL